MPVSGEVPENNRGGTSDVALLTGNPVSSVRPAELELPGDRSPTAFRRIGTAAVATAAPAAHAADRSRREPGQLPRSDSPTDREHRDLLDQVEALQSLHTLQTPKPETSPTVESSSFPPRRSRSKSKSKALSALNKGFIGFLSTDSPNQDPEEAKRNHAASIQHWKKAGLLGRTAAAVNNDLLHLKAMVGFVDGQEIRSSNEMEQHTAAEEKKRQRNVIMPDSNFKQLWDVLQMFALLYVATVVPLRIGFSVHTTILR